MDLTNVPTATLVELADPASAVRAEAEAKSILCRNSNGGLDWGTEFFIARQVALRTSKQDTEFREDQIRAAKRPKITR
jgi:hypothetical protein